MTVFPSWDKSSRWVQVYRARIRAGLETCRICGCANAWGTGRQLTLDHIHPRSLGGPSLMENATILCLDCNNRKGDGPATYSVSLWLEERRAPRSRRWSKLPLPEVPPGPWSDEQPPRSLRGHRRALERALPAWARPFYADFPPGQLPDYVKDIIAAHHGGVEHAPLWVRRLLTAG